MGMLGIAELWDEVTYRLVRFALEEEEVERPLHPRDLSGVTTYVIGGISEPFDYLPCLNYKVSCFARLKLYQYISPKAKMFRRYLKTYLSGIYEDQLLKCGWFCKHLTTVLHVDHLCIKSLATPVRITVVKCLKTNCSLYGKAIHPLVENIHGYHQNQLYYRISNWNTFFQQFIDLIQTKMAACQMVSISLLWRRLSPLFTLRLA